MEFQGVVIGWSDRIFMALSTRRNSLEHGKERISTIFCNVIYSFMFCGTSLEG